MITFTIALRRLVDAGKNESGFTTAELLGNAALGIVALAAIWGAMDALGVQVIEMIKTKMQLSG